MGRIISAIDEKFRCFTVNLVKIAQQGDGGDRHRKLNQLLIAKLQEVEVIKSRGLKDDKWKSISQKNLVTLQTKVTEEMVNHVVDWLDLAWDSLDKSKGLTLLDKNTYKWGDNSSISWNTAKENLKVSSQKLSKIRKDSEFSKKESDCEQKLIEGKRVGSCRGNELLVIESLEYCPYNRTIIDSLLKLKGKRPMKELDNNYSARLAKTTKILLSIQDYLNPDFMIAWPHFRQYSKLLVAQDIYTHAGDIVIDFIDHCILWSLVLEVPYLRLLPRERIWWFNEVYLTQVYSNKHRVEEWAGGYISSEAFVVGFHKWCGLHDVIPEILWKTEECRGGNSRVRIKP